MQDGKYGEGIPFLEKARELMPDSWAVSFYLGKAMLQLKRPAEAAPLLRKAAELNPREASVFYQLGKALQSLGREQEARAALLKVRELRAEALNREVDSTRSVAGIR